MSTELAIALTFLTCAVSAVISIAIAPKSKTSIAFVCGFMAGPIGILIAGLLRIEEAITTAAHRLETRLINRQHDL